MDNFLLDISRGVSKGGYGVHPPFAWLLHHILRLFATLPVSTAAAERSFSTLRPLKTYLRNTTSDNSLNGRALISIHRDVQVSPELVIDRFASNKLRRLQFILD